MTMEMTKTQRIGQHCARHLGGGCAAVAAADANREYASEMMDREKKRKEEVEQW